MTVPLRVVREAASADDHLAREARAYEEYLAAVERNDKVEACRLWEVFRAIHRERPAQMVERMERDKGLR